jgi:lycopene cyclase domain-containing protein
MTSIGDALGGWTYLAFELFWALPVIALHWAVGGADLLARRRQIALAVFTTTIYLSLADAVALSQQIWAINPARTIGIHFGNLPLEEGIFFLLTNLMVVQTVILVRGETTRRRMRALFGRRRGVKFAGASGPASDPAPESRPAAS